MKTKELSMVALFAALTAIGAFINIPLPYVPFTLQFMFCAFAGILLGSKLGMLSQIVYVGIGLIGIPVFTQGGGFGYIFKPTFGYLIGFIIAAFIIGKLTENKEELNIKNILSAVLTGLFCVYLIGVPYLYFINKFYLGNTYTVYLAVIYGFIMCIGGDFLLSLIIAVVGSKIIPILKKLGYISYK
ncbi:biotin transporter BioY [Romboutsia lituseburensis]|uniref:biotin transporter BioY n=1 Tax=Romboutsia lituseburensis TaxID=1537 RepID=UPI00215B2725|nr:biotin transporter BioY [Romboutsia lituseburensis]MCR8744571.1 biotin transporter BioY [Romboutsia lituseburensis]